MAMPKATVKGIHDSGNLPILEGKQKDTIKMAVPIIVSSMTMCNICDANIENEETLWRCDAFCDYDLCGKCYEKEGNVDHPHKLVSVPTKDRNKHNADTRGLATVTEMKDMLNLMRHGSRCEVQDCKFPKCRRVKWLFNHGTNCAVHSSGGCAMCKKVIHILRLHASACTEPDCQVPHCKEMRDKTQKLKEAVDKAGPSNKSRGSRRRERMKQRAEEASKINKKETKEPKPEPTQQEKNIFAGFMALTMAVMLNKQPEEKK